MTESIDRIELNPEQMEAAASGHTLGIYRPGFRHKQESLRFFRACVGDEMYEKAMSSDAGQTHPYAVARAILNQADWEKDVWIEEHGALEDFPK
jgi:hypothetical protein